MVKTLFFGGIYFFCSCISDVLEYITENEIVYWILSLIEIASFILFLRTEISNEQQRRDAIKKHGKGKYLMCIFGFALLVLAFWIGWEWLMGKLAKAGYAVAAIAATAILSVLPAGIAHIFERKKKAEKSE